jgi:hypothetical protein
MLRGFALPIVTTNVPGVMIEAIETSLYSGNVRTYKNHFAESFLTILSGPPELDMGLITILLASETLASFDKPGASNPP